MGPPWQDGVLVGPLISANACTAMTEALDVARSQGGEGLCGGRALDGPGFFMEPEIVRAHAELPIMAQETFAPILFVMTFRSLDDANAAQNAVDQGRSSAIFKERLVEAERFLSPTYASAVGSRSSNDGGLGHIGTYE